MCKWWAEGLIRTYIAGLTADVDSTAAATMEGTIIEVTRMHISR